MDIGTCTSESDDICYETSQTGILLHSPIQPIQKDRNHEHEEGHCRSRRFHCRCHPRRVHQPRQGDHPLQGQDPRAHCAADHPGPQHSGPHQPHIPASARHPDPCRAAAWPGQRLLRLHQHRLAARFLGRRLQLQHPGQHRVRRHEPRCCPGALRSRTGRTPGREQRTDRRAEQALRRSGRGNRRPGSARGREGQGSRREGHARRCHEGRPRRDRVLHEGEERPQRREGCDRRRPEEPRRRERCTG